MRRRCRLHPHATRASFTQNAAVAIDSNGNAYIADNQADTIRWIIDFSTLYEGTSPQTGAIFGQIQYASTSAPGVPSVTVEVRGPGTVIESTNSSGAYAAEDLELATWTVEPSKQGGFGSSVISGLDASYVLQHLVGSRTLSNAQKLACDVTGDGSLSSLDATRILQRSIEPRISFPAADNCSSDWLFIPDAASAQNQSQIQPLLQGGTTCRMGAIQYSIR